MCSFASYHETKCYQVKVPIPKCYVKKVKSKIADIAFMEGEEKKSISELTLGEAEAFLETIMCSPEIMTGR